MKVFVLSMMMVLGLASVAHAEAGVFCNPQNQIVQWVCNQLPSGPGWVRVDQNCFHRNTQQSCYENGGGHHGGNLNLTNTIFTVRYDRNVYYADFNGNYCAFSSSQDEMRFRRNKYGSNPAQLIERIPGNLRYTGACYVY